MAKHGTVRAVKPYELHGILYYRLAVDMDSDDNALRDVRICHDSIYENPAVGDNVELDIILNIVTEVRKKP